jgi:hypothetical protein
MVSGWKVRSVKVQKIPRRAATAIARTTIALRLYTLDAQAEISNYPEQETSYIRTGILGQKWTASPPKLRGSDLVGRVGNNISYAGRVQGSDQEEQFKKRGWPNIVDTNTKVWNRHRPLLVAAIKG